MSHLRVVGAAPPRRPPGIAPSLSLTVEEARSLRAAIRGLVHHRYGTLARLAQALGVAPGILTRTRKRPHPGLAIALARETGIPVEVLLSMPPHAATCLSCGVVTCPLCGASARPHP